MRWPRQLPRASIWLSRRAPASAKVFLTWRLRFSRPPKNKPKRRRKKNRYGWLFRRIRSGLQEQLIRKDLPLLNSVIPREFSAVLVKGRRNYLSLRRLKSALSRGKSLFDTFESADQLRDLKKWSETTHDGSLSDLPHQPASQVWDEVTSDHGNCMGRRCPTYKKCFYYQDRRRVQNAQIMVVNHALFFSDLALRRYGVSLLPDYQVVVLDEAHTVEGVAADHLGIRLTNGQIEYVLGRLYNDRTQKGLLVHHEMRGLSELVDRCRMAADEFFADLTEWREAHAPPNGRVREPIEVANQLGGELQTLSREVKKAGDTRPDETDRQDFIAAAERLTALAGELNTWPSSAARRLGLLDGLLQVAPRLAAIDSLSRATRRRPRPPRAAVSKSTLGDSHQRHLGSRQERLVRLPTAADRSGENKYPAPGQPIRLRRAGRARGRCGVCPTPLNNEKIISGHRSN